MSGDGLIDDSLVTELQAGISKTELQDYVTNDEELAEQYDGGADALVDDLREEGYDIDSRDMGDDELYLIAEEVDSEYRWEQSDGNYRFAVISDTHLGSEGEQLDSLNDFYDEVVDRDIDVVFHSGDISDGTVKNNGRGMYRGHSNHLKPEAIGWHRLEDYVAENYPEREGVDTLFITGNHDNQLFKETGFRFGKKLENRRDDLHWLGDCFATIDLGDVDMDLVHPSGGAPYTLGYRAQTWLRDKDEEDKADITIFGHLHQVLQAEAEGSHAFYAGAWQGQTPYLDRMGHKAKAGGWILDMDVSEEHGIERLGTEFIEYPLESESDHSADELSDMLNDK